MNSPARASVPVTGFLLTLLGAGLFSTKAIIVKLAFGATHTDALTLLTLRMAFALPFYAGAALLVSSQKANVRMTGAQWLLVAVLGILGYYLGSLFDFMGLRYISAGLERLILFLYPSFVVFINAVFFKQRITGVQKLALLLTYLGIVIAYVGELTIDASSRGLYLGSFLVFLCAVTYSIYIAGSGKLIPKVGANKFTAYAMLAATAGIFIHFAIAGQGELLGAGRALWGYGLALAILSTVLPSFLISQGMRRIGANNVAIISGIGPISTIAQAHFFLQEPIFLAQIGGTILVMVGVLLLRLEKASYPRGVIPRATFMLPTPAILRWKDVLYYAKYGNPEPPQRVEKTEAEWQAQLTPAQYAVLRQRGTEPPYRNAYCRSYEPGQYACAGCGSLLFDSATKYHAMSGWPSFTQPVAKNTICYAFDDSHHMQRIEAHCNVCGGHLGHVFADGPEPSGLRYCMNSASLVQLAAG